MDVQLEVLLLCSHVPPGHRVGTAVQSAGARSNWCGTGSRGSEVAALTRLYVANWDPAGDQSGEGALGLGKWIEMDRSV